MRNTFLLLLMTALGCDQRTLNHVPSTDIDPPRPARTAPAPLEPVPPEAEALFDEHHRGGTLFLSGTAQHFRHKGWGKAYATLVQTKWRGEIHDGIALDLNGMPNHTYRVGQKFDCRAVIHNRGTQPFDLNTGGNCGMTHALSLLVIPPEGGLGLGWCRGRVGGPHCFCKPKTERVGPGNSTPINTGFATMAAVEWTIDRPGRYAIIGVFRLPSAPESIVSVYSPPLLIDVEE